MTVARNDARPKVALAAAFLALGAAIPILIAAPSGDFVQWMTLVLATCGVASGLSASRWQGNIDVSAAFVCSMLAVALVGPLGVFVIAVLTEVTAWIYSRDRRAVLPVNLAATAVPGLLAAVVYYSLAGRADSSVHDIAILAGVGVGYLTLNFLVLRTLLVLLDGGRLREALRPPRELLPSLLLTVALTVAIAGVYVRYGIEAGVFVVLIIVAFAYMSRLVVIARERTAQYASLSWGVLSALVRSLDRRDGRTARHSAAVAAFARDIAIECDMGKRAAELAHTAGLLHDIGRFALPDRVMERHGTLTEADWEAIRLHPELGADLLQDLGVYGPVAEIVRAHHERIDGRGYPDGLKGDAIPEIARIVAVAEVYDTLTAEDTYRDRMTSFQAMTEMRRVAGRQLDPRFVEALATLLSGRGLDYRHADEADFDRELAMQSRVADAVAGDSSAGGSSGGAMAGEPVR
ncbi:MAG: HD-GYP domain-containing protein [Solirubrobacteraceae bacterium]